MIKGTKAKFYVSADDVTYYSAPVDSINPSFSADTLDATTLQAAEFNSVLKGLKGSTFGGNVKLKLASACKGLVGYKTVIKKSGTGVAATGLAMELVSGKLYKTTDTTKNLWSRDIAVTVYDDGVEVDSANIEKIDYMFGNVTFVSGYTVTGTITVDATYLPVTTIAARTGYSLGQTCNTPDVTTLGTDGWKAYEYGRKDISLTLDGFYDEVADIYALFDSDDAFVVEIDVANSGLKARGWFYVTADSQTADGDNPIGENLTCSLSAGCATGQSFAWNITELADTTLVDRASYEILNAMVNQTKLYIKAMLDDEAGIGYSCSTVVSDVSISGSVSDIEQMSFSCMADGTVTEL